MTEFIDYKEVLATRNMGDIAVIKSILDSANITYFFQGENFVSLKPHVVPARLMVKKEQVEEVKAILKNLKLSFNVVSLKEDSEKPDKNSKEK